MYLCKNRIGQDERTPSALSQVDGGAKAGRTTATNLMVTIIGACLDGITAKLTRKLSGTGHGIS
jgi:hypothetical protein